MAGFALLVLILFSACEQSGDIPSTEGRRFYAQEELMIREAFGRIPDLLVNDSGWIIIPDQQVPALLVHAPDGSRLATIGRRGQGPGEFQVITGVGWRGDTAWVYDRRLGRISLISPDLEIARSADVPDFPPRLTIDGVEALTSSPLVLAAPDDSQFVVKIYPRGPAASQAELPGVIYARLGPAQSVEELIAHHALSRSSYFINVPGYTGGGSYPFAIDPIYEIADDASRSVLVQVSFDDPEAPLLEVTAFDAAGDTIYVRSYPMQGEVIPPAVRDSAINAGASRLPSSAAREYRKGAFVPPIYPPIKRVAIADNGAVWVWERTQSGDKENYFIIDPEGSPFGRVTFPRGTQVEVIRGQKVWAIVRDELDVQSVGRFVISPAGEQ